MSETMHNGIKDSRLCILDDASHVSVIEQPIAFLNAVTGFLNA